MKRLLAVTIALCMAALAAAREPISPHLVTVPQPRIQIALLLDTSNSMDGLIGQAKAQLWKIVNEFASSKKDGLVPRLEVALFEYGNNSLPSREGYIRLVLRLTDDLDRVSEELFALTTNGGSEYCGHVIKNAVTTLDWSASDRDWKAIFIAGNEPFTQGGVDYRHATMAAVAKGITVSTIFCGRYDMGVRTKWADGAALADGDYMNIDQDRKVVHIWAPQDAEITRLGILINTTYIAYGTDGRRGYSNQAAQDENAAKYSSAGSNLNRALSKASGQYRNSSWDLVDAVIEGGVKLKEVKKSDLPDEMRNMTLEEQAAHIKATAAERRSIRKAINKLNKARKAYVAKEMKKAGEEGASTFDAAIIKALRRQAAARNFTIE